MGCYAFPNHVGDQHPDVPLGVDVPTLLEALQAEFPTAELVHAAGCPIQELDVSGIPPPSRPPASPACASPWSATGPDCRPRNLRRGL
jgi:hypothetical protein